MLLPLAEIFFFSIKIQTIIQLDLLIKMSDLVTKELNRPNVPLTALFDLILHVNCGTLR